MQKISNLTDIDNEWGNYCDSGDMIVTENNTNECKQLGDAPICSDIYISTKTKIAYLNKNVNLSSVFWKLPILEYHEAKEGIVKKQMKFNSSTQEELNSITNKIPTGVYVNQHIITQIINPEGRITFKDVRKISIGLSKKDIISYRGKQKGAFYNCFVVILRVKFYKVYREIHVKVFNTGKLEIPGIQTEELLYKVLNLLIKTLNDNIETSEPFNFIENKCSTVLINSNFRCGYYINRDKLYNILKTKYRINCSFDSCSYPGIQCEFYYNPELETQTGHQVNTKTSDDTKLKSKDKPTKDKSTKDNDTDIIKVSFMIFRTGSALIVGKCTEYILNTIYRFLCNMLAEEYPNISQGINNETRITAANSKKKQRKKKILILKK